MNVDFALQDVAIGESRVGFYPFFRGRLLAILLPVTDARQPFRARPNDAAVHVVPGAALIFVEDVELRAIHFDKLLDREAERLSNEHVNLDQRLSSRKIRS